MAAANLIAQVMARLDARKSILVAWNAKIDSLRSGRERAWRLSAC